MKFIFILTLFSRIYGPGCSRFTYCHVLGQYSPWTSLKPLTNAMTNGNRVLYKRSSPFFDGAYHFNLFNQWFFDQMYQEDNKDDEREQ